MEGVGGVGAVVVMASQGRWLFVMGLVAWEVQGF